MSFSNIENALVKAWTDNSAFSLPTAYENRDYTPDKSAPWAALFHMPIDTSVASLGESGTDKHSGFMQINLNYPLNQGSGAARAKADEIAAVFKAGAKFSYNGTTLTIERTKREQGRRIDGNYTIPLSVYYYTRTPR